VDEGQDASTSNGGFDKCVELFVSTNSELEVTRRDTLDT
jgi:hypothetical protein